MQEAYVIVEQQFALLRATVKEARKQEVEVLEGEKRAALRQAESIQAHVEQRRAELSRTLTEMIKLSRRESDLDFLQVELRGITPPGGSSSTPVLMVQTREASASVKTTLLIFLDVFPGIRRVEERSSRSKPAHSGRRLHGSPHLLRGSGDGCHA